ncbi:MAG: T9SS type B sorting domain-containing protein [Bacteroidetes bacterium]|nr:T9SS type B sorting domain-containing protein [Bacteroidota bacterium]
MKYPIKLHFFYILFLISCPIWGQNPVNKTNTESIQYDLTRKAEDDHGRRITDPELLKQYWLKKAKLREAQKKELRTSALTSLPLCQNGNFEEFERISSVNTLIGYAYDIGDPLNPMQCQSINVNPNQLIPQYAPNISYNAMATTVPSNFIDEYIGDINGFDQYVLKINYKDSDITMSSVRTKRYKTNNETTLKFNYKSVLQSIYESDHDNEQPFFKARIINQAGIVVDEFCLISDVNNCIFKQASTLAGNSIILYNENWQNCLLDISSIPNNQEFTVEYSAARCGLGGHFGYVYIDDVCNIHGNENLQGSIELDPLYKECPTFPLSVCGSFTVPNSGGISSSINLIKLNITDASNQVIYTSTAPANLDIVNHRFCFDVAAADIPNQTSGNYNASVSINFSPVQTNCSATNFGGASDDDANPGWDIWFLNCNDCNIIAHSAQQIACDSDRNGTEIFDLAIFNNLVTSTPAGITFSYHNSFDDAFTNTNPINNFTTYSSGSNTLFVRLELNSTCFKIVAVDLVVRAPSATISGILNVCSGSTVLTASPGNSYLWGNGATSQSITVHSPGTYQVTVTDDNGCSSIATTTILSNQTAVLPNITVTQPNCFSSTGRIEVTSPAALISFDGGLTWGTNPVLDPAPISVYHVKIQTASGCISYISTIVISPFFAAFPHCTWNNPSFCGDTGTITVDTQAALYSFDDGATWVTNNTLSNLNAGIYKIRTKDIFGCISNYFTVTLESEFLDRPTYIQYNPFCGSPGSIEITTPASEYSCDGGTTWQTSNIFNNLQVGSYVIKIKNAIGCTSPNTYVYLYNFEDSRPNYTITNAGCGVYASITITTPADFYSFDDGVSWTTNPTAINLNGGGIYKIKIRKGSSCTSLVQQVSISSQFYPLPEPNDYTPFICDALNDGIENVNLTQYEANLIGNASAHTFKYYRSFSGADLDQSFEQINVPSSYQFEQRQITIYVRVITANNCYKVAKLELNMVDSPRIYMEDAYPLCQFRTTTIDAGAGYDSYHWSNGETTQTITVTEPKHYWVTVTENHNTSTGLLICDSSKDFNVFLSNPAIIADIKTTDWTIEENSIEIIAFGLGDYEYSIDGINYQDSNHFEPLKNGIYTAYVRDKYDCGVTKEKVYLLIYPKYFTPNSDGFHDTWKLRLSEFEPGLNIKILDRNGKLLKELGNNLGWDGTLNNQPLPSDDYWFIVTRADGEIFRGHFSLKR